MLYNDKINFESFFLNRQNKPFDRGFVQLGRWGLFDFLSNSSGRVAAPFDRITTLFRGIFRRVMVG